MFKSFAKVNTFTANIRIANTTNMMKASTGSHVSP